MDKLVALGSVALLVAALNVARAAEDPKSPLDFKVDSIDGKPVDLSAYKGKVVMIVNVASKCGNTPQYKDLEELYKQYKDKGFVVLGFPANEFGAQEPGPNSEIAQFCKSTYGVDFPMFSKVVVKGDGITPLYDYLTSAKTDPNNAGPISWNFEKFLIGRNGAVVSRFKPKTNPQSPEVVKAIEGELEKK
jgi:glutathione peroxidase